MVTIRPLPPGGVTCEQHHQEEEQEQEEDWGGSMTAVRAGADTDSGCGTFNVPFIMLT